MTATGVHGPLAEGHRAIAVLVALFTAAVFLSTAATNILAGVLTLVAAVQWARYKPWWLLRQPIALACIAFFGWLLLREALDGELGREALQAVNQFRPLLFLVLWAPLFMAVRHRRAAVAATLAGLLLFMVTALAGWATSGRVFYPLAGIPYPWSLPPVLDALAFRFFDRAPDLAGPVLLLTIFGTLQLALDERRWRWLLVFALLGTAVLFAATARKSSQLVFLACAALFLFHRLRPVSLRGRLGWALAVLALAGSLAMLPVVRSGAQRVWTESVQTLSTPAQQRAQVGTSSGLRIMYWEIALQVVQSAPWLGTGESQYRQRFLAQADAMGGIRYRHANPHNEYLHVAGSLGAIGLVLYLAVHAAAAVQAGRLASPAQRRILAYYLVAALLTAVANSQVIDMVPGHFHALALLVLGWFAWDRRAPEEPA